MTDHPDLAERAAAELTAEAMREHEMPLPPALAAALIARGRAEVTGVAAPVVDELAQRRARRVAVAGWLAAAAAIAVVVAPALSSRRGQLPPAPTDSTAQLRTALAAAVSPLAWAATADSAALGAGGDVVWSDSAQAGVMRITGLAANDPTTVQYQLWIFDAARDERYPVDGGVFDVPAGASEVLVPIRAKIRVSEATLFAVTVERPGGVVVSDRSRIVLLAQRDS
jgi:hypothetical protein